MNYQANLVSIHSAEEQHFVIGLEGVEGRSPWLGGRRDPQNRDNWVWSDGTPWDYTNWEEHEPNDVKGEEDCVHFFQTGHLWNDNRCEKKVTSVCKKDRGLL